MIRRLPVLLVLAASLTVSVSRTARCAPVGREQPDTRARAIQEKEARAEAEPFPLLPAPHKLWPGVIVIAILGMFLSAAVIGPVVRANMPEQVPPAHAHDEPPGSSHHHGPSGTLSPDPDH